MQDYFRNKFNGIVAILFCFSAFISSCTQKNKGNFLFAVVKEKETGILFSNNINPYGKPNIFDYLYLYNGGGVGIGDINNDGLQDVYLVSNQEGNKLFLNKGNLQFEDITPKANVGGSGNWKTGVTMADVNNDGLLDIYVSEVGGYKDFKGRNELFINNGNLTFTESAAKYGLDAEGFNTQASFFDYDHDGDLDMFLVNHSVHSNATLQDSSIRHASDSKAGDKLFRNDLNTSGKFIEVTKEAGIYNSVVGYGLNVIVADFNNDMWEDIYVSNDFHEEDYYYLNNKNGSFTEIGKKAFAHNSRFSMGSDAADINNDGWLDLFTLDMLPEDEKIIKESLSDDPNELYQYKQRAWKYNNQFSKNCLQLNINGGKTFSDISLYAGVAATDWSWGPLIADYNNDGIKDIFVPNGILKRPNDLDFLKYASSEAKTHTAENMRDFDNDKLEKMPSGKVNNYFFEGTNDIKFINRSNDWVENIPTYSNGGAYGDLDNDGDLDIVVNNINENAFVYQNNTNPGLNSKAGFISLHLRGSKMNPFAYGTKVTLTETSGDTQYAYITATRGFESASSTLLHFGLGTDTAIKKIVIQWPDGKEKVIENVKANQHLSIAYSETDEKASNTNWPQVAVTEQLFKNITEQIALPYKHVEDFFNDFNVQELMPHKICTQGPKIAVADINGDQLDDFFVCGAKGQAGKLFMQQTNGKFVSVSEKIFEADNESEDVNAHFFDADNDGDKDLYVVSGGDEFFEGAVPLLDRLYINNGNGTFSKSGGLPKISFNKSVAISADFDKDGDLDLFVGGRTMTNRYGEIPPSFLLLNDGKGNFTEASENIIPGIKQLGMITDAKWCDLNNDGWMDLVVAGEWMPVTIFKNENGKLKNVTKDLELSKTNGLWTAIEVADINNDGYMDILCGNLGENSKLHANENLPLAMYVGDFSENGFFDQILAIEKGGSYYSFLSKAEMEKRFPVLMRKKFLDYASYAGKTLEQVFGDNLKSAKKNTANILSSIILINNKQMSFSIQSLPYPNQLSPLFSFAVKDLNNDGKNDIIAAGNFFGVSPYEGFYDAGFGSVMLGQNNIQFNQLLPWQSGLLLKGDIRDMKWLHSSKGNFILAIAKNNDSMVFFKLQKP